MIAKSKFGLASATTRDYAGTTARCYLTLRRGGGIPGGGGATVWFWPLSSGVMRRIGGHGG